MFDKVAYWKNRKAGKRGQGEVPAPVVDKNTHMTGKHLVQVGVLTFFTNREQYRRIERPWRKK